MLGESFLKHHMSKWKNWWKYPQVNQYRMRIPVSYIFVLFDILEILCDSHITMIQKKNNVNAEDTSIIWVGV